MAEDQQIQDGYGNELFFEGEHVAFYLAKTGNVKEFLGAKGTPPKAEKKLKTLCREVDCWKGTFQVQQKWKPMDKVSYGAKSVSLASLKIVNMEIRIGCVTLPGHRYYMVYGFRKKGDDWKDGDVTKFHNAAIEFLNSMSGYLN